MRRCLLLFIIIVNMFCYSASAISAQSAVLIDACSGRILYEHNASEKLPMASTTKIMTGLLACESGKLDESVKVSAFASGTEGSSLWLKPGEKMTLSDLTYGLMLKSGNDAAVAIAEHLAGNTDAFAVLMNEKAKKSGAMNTSFENPHGLDSEGHFTTAYDLSLIAREAMKNEEFAKIVATKTYSIPMQGEKWDRALKNHNKLLWLYDGCTGVKTGFTKRCGRCLVSSAERNGQKLICVTLNAPDDWNDHSYLLDYGFNNYHAETPVKKGVKVTDFTYDEKNNRCVSIVAENDFTLSLKDGDIVTTSIKLSKIKVPSEKGAYAGEIEVLCNGEKVGSVKLVTDKDIKKLSIFERIILWFKKLF